MQTSSTNINDSFFDGNYKEVWRRLIPPGLSEAECSFVEDVAGLKPNDSVLDLMCGYGRHALELGRRGYNVTAVDNQNDYINEIKSTAKHEGISINAFTAGALDSFLPGESKAILCMGNSFAFFNREDALQLLSKIAAHLATDGVLIINTWMIAEIAIRHFRAHEWHRVEGFKYLLEYKFLFQPNRIESEHTIVADNGKVDVINGVDYIFTLDELATMFQEVGLQLKDVYSTPKKRKFSMGDNRAYLTITKSSLSHS